MNIITPASTILPASLILAEALVPGHKGGKRVRSQIHARIVRGTKALHILPNDFRAAYVGLVLDTLGEQYLLFVQESLERELDGLGTSPEDRQAFENKLTAKLLTSTIFYHRRPTMYAIKQRSPNGDKHLITVTGEDHGLRMKFSDGPWDAAEWQLLRFNRLIDAEVLANCIYGEAFEVDT